MAFVVFQSVRHPTMAVYADGEGRRAQPPREDGPWHLEGPVNDLPLVGADRAHALKVIAELGWCFSCGSRIKGGAH